MFNSETNMPLTMIYYNSVILSTYKYAAYKMISNGLIDTGDD